MLFTFNSVVFNSHRLSEIRAFYEGKLGFPTGTYEKDGKKIPDFSESYVNYHIGGGLIGFEHEHGKEEESTEPSLGDLVINVSNFDAFRAKVEKAGIPIVSSNPHYFIIKDPEGRTLIFEPSP